jgi:hypothetical protein
MGAGKGLDLTNPQYRSVLMELMMRCATVCNWFRPFQKGDPWVKMLREEAFAKQETGFRCGDRTVADLPAEDLVKNHTDFGQAFIRNLVRVHVKAVPALSPLEEIFMTNLTSWSAFIKTNT